MENGEGRRFGMGGGGDPHLGQPSFVPEEFMGGDPLQGGAVNQVPASTQEAIAQASPNAPPQPGAPGGHSILTKLLLFGGAAALAWWLWKKRKGDQDEEEDEGYEEEEEEEEE